MALYTFWEGRMPAYIKLCLATWKRPYTVLNYDNLHKYTDLNIEPLKRFTLPQIADCVRVHVLRDHGGYWLDADTIMLSGNLPEETMVGDPVKRTNSIGVLHAKPGSEMFKEWARYQDEIISGPYTSELWSIMGNSFTDDYLKCHPEVSICPIERFYPELSMIGGDISRSEKYRAFYFYESHHLSDLQQTDLLMLHNSWTPKWYKELTEEDVLKMDCTMSNILREAL